MYRLLPFPLILFLFLAPVGAEEFHIENLQLSAEFTSQARCQVEVSAQVLREAENLSLPELEVRLSKPGPSSLKMELEGSVVMEFPEGVKNLLPYLTPQTLNHHLAAYRGRKLGELPVGLMEEEWLRKLPKGFENLVLEEIKVKELDWLQPGLKFSLSLVLGGVEEGEEYLPMTLRFSVQPMEGGMHLYARFDFRLPREGDEVVVNLEELPELVGELEGISVGSFSFTLKVPEGTTFSNLPRGFENEGGVFTFSGDNMEVLQSLLSDMGEMSFSYAYSPPSRSIPLLVTVIVVLLLLLGGIFWRLRRKK